MSVLSTILDLLLVLAGFSIIITLHELGHFLAARWAGIRVLAFALGFGPAIISFRKGMGVRLGSSEKEYQDRLNTNARGVTTLEGSRATPQANISPTEYRWNILPLGGYVKMLGQDDADPTAKSDAADSYQNCPPPKRMVVISAGVVMNIITAAVLFVIVFTVGLKTEPAKVGEVRPGSPAALAVASNAAALGITTPGLRAGDTIAAIDGVAPESFKDVQIASAMAARGRALRIDVRRPGVDAPLFFAMVPEEDKQSRLLSIGVGPALSAQIVTATSEAEQAELRVRLDKSGLASVPEGATLTRVGSTTEVTSAWSLDEAARTSGGAPFSVTFRAPSGQETMVNVTPKAELQVASFADATEPAREVIAEHLLGLMPVLMVEEAQSKAEKAGLKTGDVFARIGDVAWPSAVEGIAEVRRHSGKDMSVVVLRREGDRQTLVNLPNVPVSSDGTIGFSRGTTADIGTWIAKWPAANRFAPGTLLKSAKDPADAVWSGATLGLVPGSRIMQIGSTPVASLLDLRLALQAAAKAALSESADATLTIPITVQPPPSASTPEPAAITMNWTLTVRDVQAVRDLTWTSPIGASLFQTEQILLKASSPLTALGMGLRETKNVMIQTYLTFARLFQGTVRVEHLRGPVGIAHVGTLIAEKGFVWLLFFMAVVSVNLAVLNFLPLPIVDGGHMVFLIYEHFTGKPVSANVQGAVALVGILIIGSLFLVVTFNDLVRLIGI